MAFEDVDIRIGEQLVGRVDGELDAMAGAIATVEDRAALRRVHLMPSLRDEGVLLVACDCREADEPPCGHVWSVLRVIDARGIWPRDARIPTDIEVTDPDDPDLELISEGAGVAIRGVTRSPVAAAAPRLISPDPRPIAAVPRAWHELLHAWPRATAPATGKLARIEYVIQATAVAALETGKPLDDRACAVLVATAGGERRYHHIDSGRMSPEDLAIRTLLFGVEELVNLGTSRSGLLLEPNAGKQIAVRIDASRAGAILEPLAATHRFGWLPDPDGALVPLSWDTAGGWELAITIAPMKRWQARVSGALCRGDARIELDTITAVAGAGIAIVGDRAISVAVDGLGRWLSLLAREVTLARKDVATFIDRTCSTRRPPRLELGEVGIELAELPPTCRVVIEPKGRQGFLARAELAYQGEPVELGAPTTIVRARGKRIVRRRLDDEHAWALAVRAIGGSLDHPWSVSPGRLRELVEDAAARKLEVFYAGGRLRSTGAFTPVVESGIDWFDLSIAVDDAASLDMPELLAALRSGRPLVRLSDGTTALIPPWLERRAAALTAAPLEGGAVRFRKAEALVLANVVDAASGADVDAGFANVRRRLEDFAGMTPRDAPRGFGATLRDYQRDGLGWLHFLRELGLGGCLADDMGLGKTVQVLALLDHLRIEHARRRNGSRKPSLIVAPRSLVFHWIDEARRFAPKLAMLEWHGPERGQRAAELATADVIVTTYATLRLDLERLTTIEYAVVALDEAHAIKNATTATARAARALHAELRLALTGTPVENRLDDLASIFDFLNPGLLGRTAVLRAIGEPSPERDPTAPIHDTAKLAELSEARALGRVLRPFLMRRTKQQVLTELPPKTECIVSCRLEGAERRRYDELRDHYRRALLPAVERDGVGRNAIVVLEALLRLRQAALHPGLLDPRRTDADSAKLDALVERLRAAISSGHRALVFSQFTTLLGIVMARLEREEIGYEYLDGETRDRRARVAAFQSGSAPVFLLSLKAGGTGLNLTAADHVFLLDPWWNPAVEAQAIDRVHRIGQGRPVTAYRLIAEDTVEAKILALQAHKRALFDNVFEESGIIANLSAAQLRGLLE